MRGFLFGWLLLTAACTNDKGEPAVDTGSSQEADADVDADTDADTDTGDTHEPDPDDTGEPSWPNDNSPIGINLDRLTDWGGAWVFVDLFKQSRAWIPQLADDSEWNTGEELDIDDLGWVASLAPGQAAGTILVTGTDGHYPEGQYTLLYDGTGTMELNWDAGIAEETPGRILVDVTPTDEGIYLKLVETDPLDPVRNIRFIMPGFEETHETSPFHPLYIERLRQFSTLRFMPMQNTSSDHSATWADRTTPEHATQARDQGVALEYMIALANEVHADAWFSMHHAIDDTSANAFATMVREQFDPDLTVYMEYSNEIWNGIFPQATFAQEQGLALELSEIPYEAQLRFASQRSVELFQIWRGAWGGSSRVKHVLSAQAANSWTGTVMMEWKGAYEMADALAIAPYFGGNLGREDDAMETAELSVDELFEHLESSLEESIEWININSDNARANELSLMAYEGGQHLVGVGEAVENEALNDLFRTANRDPRMGALYVQYLDAWRDNGGEMFMNFAYVGNWSKYGYWGALEYQDQPIEEAPKMSALLNYIDNNIAWWVTDS